MVGSVNSNGIQSLVQQQQTQARQGVRQAQAQQQDAAARGAKAIRTVMTAKVQGTGMVLNLKA